MLLLGLLFACSEWNIEPLDTSIEPIDTQETLLDPIAICTVIPNPAIPLVDEVTWHGSDSYDSYGMPLEFQWNLLSKPEGSVVQLSAQVPNIQGWIPDLAGQYTAQLTVSTPDNRESSCQAVLNSVPMQDLWIELYWNKSGDDLDLHLLAPGGQLETTTDCYYYNCTPWSTDLDWGIIGWPQDNPHLDLDDIPGTGPENINIQEPQSGIYTVIVHDYPGSYYGPPNHATVNIYISGILSWSDTRIFYEEDHYETYALIDISTGQIISQ